jgi:hypothetical protein
MAWDFLKKIVKGSEDEKKGAAHAAPAAVKPAPATKAEAPKAAAPAAAKPAAPAKTKAHSEKTDDELAAELDAISPQILAQAKEPQMRALIINIYRQMLVAGVDINDDKEVKKWMKKHPEVLQGGQTIKVATVRHEGPKVGRNDPCPCGSGKKFKKCCEGKA